MTPSATQWAYGGPLARLPAQWACLLLALVVLAAAAFAWNSYRRGTRRLTASRALLLSALRTALVAVLCLALANPVRIHRFTVRPPLLPPPPAQTLAVLVDRSDSMTRPDNRGQTRLDDAAARWRRLEPAARTAFSRIGYWSFGADLRPAADLAAALARTGGTGATDLYGSILATLRSPAPGRPNAIVVLTDGLDTTSTSVSLVRDAALAAQVPLYFVAGANRTPPEPYLRVRDWRVPPTALRNTEVTIDAAFEAYAASDRVQPFSVWVDGRKVGGGEVPLALGPNLIPWKFQVPAGEPGERDLTLRWGAAPSGAVAARARMTVVDRRPFSVLLVEGALDWGYRTMAFALANDPSIHVFAGFQALNPGGVRPSATASQSLDVAAIASRFSGQLAADPKFYNPYACVILSRVDLLRLGAAQVRALDAFVRAGGGAIFVNPIAVSEEELGDSPMRELLPVVFSGLRPNPSDVLLPFTLTAAGRDSPIFAAPGGGSLLPMFQEEPEEWSAKPAAEILATEGLPPNGHPEEDPVLLAVQNVGAGRTAFLGTDGLWRWQLSEPSTSHAVQNFWEQFAFAVGRSSERQGVRFIDAPASLAAGQTATLHLGGVGAGGRPEVTATLAGGPETSLPLSATQDPSAPWTATWRPARAGDWMLTARAPGAEPAYAFTSVTEPPRGELARTPPAIDAMRALATATGGALLGSDAPPSWTPPRAQPALRPVTEQQRYLEWDSWPVLGFALGLFALELGLRRLWRLM